MGSTGACSIILQDKAYSASVAKDLAVPELGQHVMLPEVKLQEGATIEGRVLNARTGAPVAGVPIMCRADDQINNLLMADQNVKSDEEGRYRASAPPGKIYISMAEAGDTTSNFETVPSTKDGKRGAADQGGQGEAVFAYTDSESRARW